MIKWKADSFIGIFSIFIWSFIKMAVERTLSIVKPDAVAKNVIGQIYSRFENAGLKIIAARMMQLSVQKRKVFMLFNKDRPFFKDLV